MCDHVKQKRHFEKRKRGRGGERRGEERSMAEGIGGERR